MNMNFKWLSRPNDGYTCQNYRCNGILLGSYYHTMVRNDPDGEYSGKIFLPDFKGSISGTREEVKSKIEELCKEWIEILTGTSL